MMDIQPIVAFLKRTYPNPEVDSAWVRECIRALKEAGSNATVDDVHAQFLYSDLSQSTLSSSSSRIFPSGEIHNINLFQKPTLLQIHYLSEIGYSAFQIQHTMEQRSEVLSGQSLIRRMEDENQDDDQQENIEEGKVPPYPRSMLKFELSDGREIIKAIEYKRINGLVLGQTSLGCKLLCQNVRCLRDTLLLTPENTQVIESSVEHLEALQKDQFLNDLKRRMGKIDDEENVNSTTLPRVPQRRIQPPPAVRPTPIASSSRTVIPKRSQVQPTSPEIIPTAGPSRSRYFPPPPSTTNQPLFDPPSPEIVKPTPRRANGVQPSLSRKRSIVSIDDEYSTSSKSTGRTPRAAAKAATTKAQQLYHDIPNDKLTESDEFEINDDDGYDYDIDESFIRQIDEVEARASFNYTKPKVSQTSRQNSNNDVYDINDDEDEDDDFMILDGSMIRQIDNITNSHNVNNNSNKGKSKQSEIPINKSKKRYRDPDEDDDQQYLDGFTIDDEDEFGVDESFIRHLDEVEADQVQKKISQGSGSNRRTQSGGSNGSGSRIKKKTPSSSLEDSLKENKFPDIIEISD